MNAPGCIFVDGGWTASGEGEIWKTLYGQTGAQVGKVLEQRSLGKGWSPKRFLPFTILINAGNVKDAGSVMNAGLQAIHLSTNARLQIDDVPWGQFDCDGAGKYIAAVPGSRLRLPDGTIRLGKYSRPVLATNGEYAFKEDLGKKVARLLWVNALGIEREVVRGTLHHVGLMPSFLTWSQTIAGRTTVFGQRAHQDTLSLHCTWQRSEYGPTPFVTATGEVWVLSRDETRILARPWPDDGVSGPQRGYAVPASKAVDPHVKAEASRFVFLWAKDGLNWKAVSLDTPLVNLSEAPPATTIAFPPLNRKADVWGHFWKSDRPQVGDDPDADFPQNCTWIETLSERDRFCSKALPGVIDADNVKNRGQLDLEKLTRAKTSTRISGIWFACKPLDKAEQETAKLQKHVEGHGKRIYTYLDDPKPPSRAPKAVAIRYLGLCIYRQSSTDPPAKVEARWRAYLTSLPAEQRVVLIVQCYLQYPTDTAADIKAVMAVSFRLGAEFPNVRGFALFSDEPSRGLRHPKLAELRAPLKQWFQSVEGRP